MNARAKKLLSEVLELPSEERAELIEEVIASLEGPPVAADGEALGERIERRIREVEEGKVNPLPAKDLVARVRARLRNVG